MNTLKIKHTIKRDGRKLEGQITDVIWNDNERGDGKEIFCEKGIKYICSRIQPILHKNEFFIWGYALNKDSIVISYTYQSEQEAQEMLDFINEHTVGKEINLYAGSLEGFKIDENIDIARKYVINRATKIAEYEQKEKEKKQSELKEGDWCYVSDLSEQHALTKKQKRIFLYKFPGSRLYKYVCVGLGEEENFYSGMDYSYYGCKYVVPIPKEEKKERKLMMTDSEWEDFQKKNGL